VSFTDGSTGSAGRSVAGLLDRYHLHGGQKVANGTLNVTGGMQRLRLAELMAALSLATDLGMGQPLEQALRTCLIAIALAERMRLAKHEISEVFYVALLRFLGCTVDAHELAEIFGGDNIAARRASAPVVGGSPLEFGRELLRIGAGQGPVRRFQLFAKLPGALQQAGEARRGHCEVAEHLARRLELPAGVQRSLGDENVRWDGLAAPKGFSLTAGPIRVGSEFDAAETAPFKVITHSRITALEPGARIAWHSWWRKGNAVDWEFLVSESYGGTHLVQRSVWHTALLIRVLCRPLVAINRRQVLVANRHSLERIKANLEKGVLASATAGGV